MSFAKKLNNESGMPQMDAAFAGWFSPITIGVVTQVVTDGDLVQSVRNVTFKGVIQPLTTEQLKVKPEGERSFRWYMIHCLTGSLNLNTNDLIYYKSKKYKVMGIWDWSLDNFIEYQIVEDFQ